MTKKLFIMILAFLSSNILLAKNINIDTYSSAPNDKWLNRTLNLKLLPEFTELFVDNNKYLLVNPDKTEIFINKDKKDNLNKFNILLNYDLYINNKKKGIPSTLYIQCPTTETTYATDLDAFTAEIVEGQRIVTYNKNRSEVINHKILDSGFYAFEYAPKDKKPLIKNDPSFLEEQLDLICMTVYKEYAQEFLEEHNKKLMYEKFDLIE